MKIQSVKNVCWQGVRKTVFIVMLSAVIVNSGCNIFGFLASPGAFEKKIPPHYDLAKQQDRKILLWVECPHSSRVDYDVQEKLTSSFLLYLTEKVRIRPENTLLPRQGGNDRLAQDPVKIAREMKAGYVLLVQVEEYELVPMTVKNYYSGQMITRAVLMDTDLGIAAWPKDPAGKVIQIGVDLETKGRDATVGRLVSETAHCTLRYLYPCEKLKFKSPDEQISVQDAFETETY